MERRRIDIEIAQLLLDERKAAYLQTEKDVLLDDILEVLFNVPHFFALPATVEPATTFSAQT